MKPLNYHPKPPKPHKYGAKATVVDGIRFDSKHEAEFYQILKSFQKIGEISFFLRQVPIHLPGGVILRIDFLVFYSDGTVRFIDAKGFATQTYKAKKAIAEAIFPIEIEEV